MFGMGNSFFLLSPTPSTKTGQLQSMELLLALAISPMLTRGPERRYLSAQLYWFGLLTVEFFGVQLIV
jgi:hypothetical protein